MYLLVQLMYRLNNLFSKLIDYSGAFHLYSKFDPPTTNFHAHLIYFMPQVENIMTTGDYTVLSLVCSGQGPVEVRRTVVVLCLCVKWERDNGEILVSQQN